MWNCHGVDSQIQKLITTYPSFKVVETDLSEIRLNGVLEIYRSACGFVLQKSYSVDILIPRSNIDLPSVIDTGNSIDASYPHRYLSGALCLETDTCIKNRFIDEFVITEWIDEFVEPYFFSYEYFQRYGIFPFGERPHGALGVIDTYKKFFHELDDKKVFSLMIFSAENKYRGHHPCPCKSGKNLRQCHGPYIFPFMSDERKSSILRCDIINIEKELNDNESNKQHQTRTK